MVLPVRPDSTIFFIEKSYKRTKKYIFTSAFHTSPGSHRKGAKNPSGQKGFTEGRLDSACRQLG